MPGFQEYGECLSCKHCCGKALWEQGLPAMKATRSV